jgi:hypothetical protein
MTVSTAFKSFLSHRRGNKFNHSRRDYPTRNEKVRGRQKALSETIIGRNIQRKEAWDKVTGAATAERLPSFLSFMKGHMKEMG